MKKIKSKINIITLNKENKSARITPNNDNEKNAPIKAKDNNPFEYLFISFILKLKVA